jgi:hypothetical protein
MQRTTITLALLGLFTVLRAQGADAVHIDPIARVVQGNDAMAFRLYAQLAQTDGNLVFSPFGISMALSMTAAGANGNTLDEMRQVLVIQQPDADHHGAFSLLSIQIAQDAWRNGVVLRIRNSLWLDHAIRVRPAFRLLAEQTYRANLFTVDFGTALCPWRIQHGPAAALPHGRTPGAGSLPHRGTDGNVDQATRAHRSRCPHAAIRFSLRSPAKCDPKRHGDAGRIHLGNCRFQPDVTRQADLSR